MNWTVRTRVASIRSNSTGNFSSDTNLHGPANNSSNSQPKGAHAEETACLPLGLVGVGYFGCCLLRDWLALAGGFHCSFGQQRHESEAHVRVQCAWRSSSISRLQVSATTSSSSSLASLKHCKQCFKNRVFKNSQKLSQETRDFANFKSHSTKK